MDGVQVRPLTVDAHEPGFLASVGSENRQPFWFQSDKRGASPFGPVDPQALNRYSYVRNNPLRWTDPTGHSKRKVGNESASYDDVCSKGKSLVDCDTQGSSTVYNEQGDVLKQVCNHNRCEYIWSGTGMYQDFARKVDSMMANYANALIAIGTASGSILAGIAACFPTAGLACLAGLVGAGVSDVIAYYFTEAYLNDLQEAQRMYDDIASYNRRYHRTYP